MQNPVKEEEKSEEMPVNNAEMDKFLESFGEGWHFTKYIFSRTTKLFFEVGEKH